MSIRGVNKMKHVSSADLTLIFVLKQELTNPSITEAYKEQLNYRLTELEEAPPPKNWATLAYLTGRICILNWKDHQRKLRKTLPVLGYALWMRKISALVVIALLKKL